MVRIVAYDVAGSYRLRRVAAICEDYGCRLQKSIFRCTLSEERFMCLRERLMRVLNPDEDRLLIITLDENCADRVWSVGRGAVPDTAAAALVF